MEELTQGYLPQTDEAKQKEAMDGAKDGLSINYNVLGCYTILALQELTALVKQQKERIDGLTGGGS